ncbi:MAG: uroporphyrinogen decarboxylase [Chloroflexota bacterium]|nr:MAG: uroporphyrinogen decarboxylase [Chloroflexota bacterium]
MSHTSSRRARNRGHATEMTSMERVRSTLAGQDVDRVPFCVWHHFKPRNEPGALARETLMFFAQWGLDIFKVMPDIPYPYPDNSIHEPHDWYGLPSTASHDATFGRMVDAVSLVRDAVDDDAPVLITIFSPFTYAMKFAGKDRVLEHARDNPIELHHGLTVIAENLEDFGTACIEAGADGVFLAAQGAGDGLLTPAQYGEFARPYELAVLRECSHGWLNTLHVHAASGLDIDPFLKYPVSALSWSDRLTGISLASVRAKAPELCLMGGVSERGPILSGTENEILAEMRDALAQTGGGERLILANGCSIPNDIDDARIRLAREQVDKLGARR